MKRRLYLAAIAAVSIASSSAYAQVVRRDHRDSFAPTQRVPSTWGAQMSISSFSPAAGPAGSTVTIRGANFAAGTVVVYGGRTIQPTRLTRTLVQFVVPIGAPDGPIALRAPRIGTFAVGSFNVVQPAPLIHNYAPYAGQAGTTVTIRGANFEPGTMVLFGTMRLAPVKLTSSYLTFVIPNGAVDGAISVVVPGQRRLPVGSFDVLPPPTIVSSYTPAAGPAGTTVAITGNHFVAGTKVMYGNQLITPRSITSRRIVFVVPNTRLDGHISLKVPGTIGSLTVGSFDMVLPRPMPTYPGLYDQDRELTQSRWNRRNKTLAGLRGRWGRRFLVTPAARAELELHAERTAALQRMLRLATNEQFPGLIQRINRAIDREDKRHEAKMSALWNDFRPGRGRR